MASLNDVESEVFVPIPDTSKYTDSELCRFIIDKQSERITLTEELLYLESLDLHDAEMTLHDILNKKQMHTTAISRCTRGYGPEIYGGSIVEHYQGLVDCESEQKLVQAQIAVHEAKIELYKAENKLSRHRIHVNREELDRMTPRELPPVSDDDEEDAPEPCVSTLTEEEHSQVPEPVPITLWKTEWVSSDDEPAVPRLYRQLDGAYITSFAATTRAISRGCLQGFTISSPLLYSKSCDCVLMGTKKLISV